MKRHAILPLVAAAALLSAAPPQGAAAAGARDGDRTGSSEIAQTEIAQAEIAQMGPAGTEEQTASAQDATARAYGASNEIRTADGIRFACTGVGKQSRDNPKWNELSTKIVYAAPDGAYLAGITTRISRADGGEVIFSQRCDGPWLLVGLEPGEYQVTAVSGDGRGSAHQESARLSVGPQGRTEEVIRFPTDPSG